MKIIELDRPAIYKAIRSEEVSVRAYTNGYKFISRSRVIEDATPKSPVYRYAKNFTRDKQEYSLLLISKENDINKVEAFFEELAKELDEKKIKNSLSSIGRLGFKYLDTYYEE